MRIANNILELIGHTPLVKINKINNGSATVLAKLEYFNPASSIKDRPALNMIEEAEKNGLIDKETVIIEPTSGNTGIGLAMVCAVKGYKIILTMPETMSIERCKLLKAFGAELVLTDGKKGMQGAVDKAQELHKEIKNSFIPQQFSNPANPQIHSKTTAQEIWNDTDGKVDIVIAGVGTGGTISGIAKYLKAKKSSIKIVAVEPISSPLLSQGEVGAHSIQGIGANFIPENFERKVVDEIFCVSDEDAIQIARLCAQKEGIFCGISSGAAMYTALQYSLKPENYGKTIVVIIPDTGERYLSVI